VDTRANEVTRLDMDVARAALNGGFEQFLHG
jgi:hypothetical protein